MHGKVVQKMGSNSLVEKIAYPRICHRATMNHGNGSKCLNVISYYIKHVIAPCLKQECFITGQSISMETIQATKKEIPKKKYSKKLLFRS